MYYALIFLILYSFFLSLVINYRSNLVNKSLAILLLTFITFIMGIRYGVGVDYFNYLERFNLYYEKFSIEYIDSILRFFIKTWFDKFHYYTFVMAFISCLFIYLGLRKRNINGIYVLLFVFIYIIDINFVFANIMRQGVAASIFFYCSTFIVERRFKKYLMYIIIGTGFHASMLFLIPLYFIKHVKIISNFKFILLIFVAYLLIAFNIAPEMLHIISSRIPYYSNYFNMQQVFYREFNILSLGVMLKVALGITLAFLSNKIIFSKREILDINFYLIGITINILAISSFIFSRIGIYFFVFSISAIPIIISKISNKYLRVLVFFAVIIIFGIFYVNLLIDPGNLEYKSIFEAL